MNPYLTEAFLDKLFCNARQLRAGYLGTEPLIAGYSVLRTRRARKQSPNPTAKP